jgi:hypothetical protein
LCSLVLACTVIFRQKWGTPLLYDPHKWKKHIRGRLKSYLLYKGEQGSVVVVKNMPKHSGTFDMLEKGESVMPNAPPSVSSLREFKLFPQVCSRVL